ncbi:hypothetical protein [Schumannella sp. 10F1B-5-1]|uniref:hypothetical protein n=1 Tax=Schumannella sp. 10F1B-5-1 TaxID=2590780 RepID=UPI0011310A3E|nr:hypothetical protein [Schumannella sp. 10F1B-5-1]TPW73086.1 hypothetical protein FJ658_07540 [Schumannella sp. 10F1B-5-1]
MRGRVPISPQQIDPLSWLTGPYIPAAFAVFQAVSGVLVIATGLNPRHLPGLQLFAIALAVASHLVVHFAASRRSGAISIGAAVTACSLSGAAMLLSAVGYQGIPIPVEVWWGSLASCMTLGSLAPYLPARWILALGIGVGVATVPLSAALVTSQGNWGVVAGTIIIATPIVVSTAITVTFSHGVVRSMQRLLEARSRTVVVAGAARDQQMQEAERARLARLTSRAVPFLEQVLERGRIDEGDRALAGQLARRLRDDLVTQANASWLDEMEGSSRLVVVDPDRRADRLRPPQRTALRGLIRALLAAPEVDQGSLLVELRGRPDGSTAVGVSLDVELPDGRRIMHLAPYYLTLQMTATDVVWNRDRLSVSFQFPDADT